MKRRLYSVVPDVRNAGQIHHEFLLTRTGGSRLTAKACNPPASGTQPTTPGFP